MKKCLALTILLTLAMTVGLNLALAKNNDNNGLQISKTNNQPKRQDSRRSHPVKVQKTSKYKVK